MVSDPFLKRISGIAGCALALVCTWLSFEFGLSIHWAVAAGLVVITFLAAYTPAIAYDIWTNKGRIPGIAASIVAVAVVGLDITTSSSTLTVHRVADTTGASIQNTRYEDARKDVADLEAKVKLFESRMSDLKSANGWTGAKPAKAYAGEIAAMDLAIEQETARGGCKAKCLALTQRKAELEANQATAAEHERMQGMYNATVAALEKARAASKGEAKAVSSVETQNLKLASIVTLNRKPGEDAVYWTDTWLGVAIGCVLTLAACFFNWVAHSNGSISNMIASQPARREERSEPVALKPAVDPLADYSRRLEAFSAQFKGGAGVTGKPIFET